MQVLHKPSGCNFCRGVQPKWLLNRRVFVSMVADRILSNAQNAFKWAVVERIQNLGFQNWKFSTILERSRELLRENLGRRPKPMR